MASASYLQTSFLGGIWSKFAQGRFDKPDYKAALNVCLNSYPIEEGAWTRRAGERFLAATRSGAPGRVIAYDFLAAAPYMMEFTDSHIRFFGSYLGGVLSLVTTNDDQVVVSVSTADPAVVTLENAPGWVTGDQVFFRFGVGIAAAFCPLLRNRVFILTEVTTTTYKLADAITGTPIDGSTLGWGSGVSSVSLARVADLGTPYTLTDWPSVRSVQADIGAFLFNTKYRPSYITAVPPTDAEFAKFSFVTQEFLDGPYLDPFTETTASMSTSGSNVTLATSGTTEISFVESDATNGGRLVRIFNEPPPYNPATTYNLGDSVAWQGTYYTSLVGSNTGNQPDLSIADWQINTNAAAWIWGHIFEVADAQHIMIALDGGTTPLYDTAGIYTWQVGVFSDTTGWPTCGCYYEGRLWVSGAVPNRIDSSEVNNTLSFSPTAADGTVADNNGISYTFNATDSNPVFWMNPTSQGIVCGTQGGEWLVQASALNDPLTPTSMQAHRVTRYGCANIEPRDTGLTMVFVQRWQRKIYEYFADVFSGRFTAPNLAVNAANLTHNDVAELAFQRERTPIIWQRDELNNLAGLTYKRDNLFSSQGPNFMGWHSHTLGSGRGVESLCGGPSQFTNLDSIALVTNDVTTNVRHVSVLTDLFDEDDLLTAAWFLDDAVVPSGGVIDLAAQTITFNGLWHLNGKTVTVFAGGLDCGDWPVANGSVTVPFGDGVKNLFCAAFIASISGQTISNAPGSQGLSVSVDVMNYESTTSILERFQIPAVIGFTYTSQGQLLRKIEAADAGARNGPALGKPQRQYQFAALIAAAVTGTLSFGTNFDKLHVANFKTKGNKPYTEQQVYSDVWWNTLDDNAGFNSAIAWEISRPLPATITAFEGFITTEDR